MDFKCNADWNEKLVAEETRIKWGTEYGLEQDMKWKIEKDGNWMEYNGKMEWEGGWK